MPTPSELASQITIKLNGSEVQQSVMTKLASVAVDQHTHMPDMFTLRFHDPGLELLDRGPFDLTDQIEIEAERQDGEKIVLVCGEITALEPDFNEGMIADLVIRGFDQLHRLYRETTVKLISTLKTVTWLYKSPRQPVCSRQSILPARFMIISTNKTNQTCHSLWNAPGASVSNAL